MSEHWNVQIKVQRVTNEDAIDGARGLQQALSGQKREITEVLSLAVVADTEAEAYAKARRILDVQNGGK